MSINAESGLNVPAIICKNLPEDLCDKQILEEHFNQFGKVLAISLKSRVKCMKIYYETIEGAENAIAVGGKCMGYILDLRWDTSKLQCDKDADLEWYPDPEVMKELDAMGSIGNSLFKRSYNLRPKGMDVDVSLPTKNITTSKSNLKTVNMRNEDRTSKFPLKKVNHNKHGWTADQNNLLSILKQPAITLDDKLKVLDARDKLIRLRTKKPIDIAITEHLVGTCPDMCPEKERIMRQIGHQISVYEQDPLGRGMDAALAVKQYSRSSADQEVPLPHELRSVSILHYTMDYLMHSIMNLCDSSDVNFAEWYHFLWDRTRGIRKDITQQALGCQGSVLLLEQCARFHIHCSARLVAEDVSVFDHKINTENLTKCLQTLKYMYHDLHIKNENCENEAEFRAYIILLNLNDGNFMWEVQQLKPEIRKSPEVQFALKVYSAVNENNYVKFFKLVHESTYLNACILLRYFVQVRSKALLTLVSCYSPRASNNQFALNELTTLLAFEDVESAKDFVLSFGLLFNEMGTHLVLDKKNYSAPLIQYNLDRAINVVESKRKVSVGEVVSGRSAARSFFESYTPSSSFTDNGIFVITEALSAILEGSQEKIDEPDSIVTKQPLFESITKPIETTKPLWSGTLQTEHNSDHVFSQKDVPKEGRFLNIFSAPTLPESHTTHVFGQSSNKGGFTFKFDTTTNQQTSSIFGNSIFSNIGKPTVPGQVFNFASGPDSETQFTTASKPLSKSTPGTQTFSEQRKLTRDDVIQKQEIELQHQKQLELEKIKQLEMEKLCELEIEKQKLAKIQKQRLLDAEKQKQIEFEKKRLLKMKQEEQALELEKQKKIEHAMELRRKQQEDESRKHQEMLILKEKEHKHNNEIKFAVQQLIDDLLKQAEDIYKQERLNEIGNSITAYKQRLFIKKWMDKITSHKKKRRAIDQNPIWLPSRSIKEEVDELFITAQTQTLNNIKRYKVGYSTDIDLPKIQKKVMIDIPLLFKILTNSYAKLGCRVQTEIFWKVSVSLPDLNEFSSGLNYIEKILTDFFGWQDRGGVSVVINKYQTERCFHYCVEKKDGVESIDRNSNGILFILNEINRASLNRISSSLKTLPNMSKMPISCLIVNTNIPSKDNLDLLKALIDQDRHVLNYTLLLCTYPSITETVQKSLEFLAKCIEKPVPLELNYFKQFLHLHLVTELWQKVSSYSTWNTEYKKCLQSPNVVIDIHNEAVQKLKEIIMDESCFGYQDFCKDFALVNQVPDVLPCNYRYFPPFWKSSSYRTILLKSMDALKLPKFDNNWPPETIKDLEKLFINYLSKIFEDSSTLLYKVLTILLKNIDPIHNFPDTKNLSWVNVLEVIILEKIEKLDVTLTHTEFHRKSVFHELIVVYDTAMLDTYRNSEWFYLVNPTVQTEVENRVKNKVLKKKPLQIDSCLIDIDLDELEKSLREEKQDNLLEKQSIRNTVDQFATIMSDLEESMKIHKSICTFFQTNFNSALSSKK